MTVMVEVIKVVSSWSGQVIVVGQTVVVVYVYMVTSSSLPQFSGLVAMARPARAPKRMLRTIMMYVLA